MSAEYISAALDLDVTGPDHTRRLALTLAQHLNAGDVLLLSGELGAGKVDERAAEPFALPLGHDDDEPWAYSLPVAAKRSAVAFSRLSPKSEPSSLASAVFAISVAWANISS